MRSNDNDMKQLVLAISTAYKSDIDFKKFGEYIVPLVNVGMLVGAFMNISFSSVRNSGSQNLFTKHRISGKKFLYRDLAQLQQHAHKICTQLSH